MARRYWTEDDRRRRALVTLRRLGVVVSPEFARALFSAPREKIVLGGWQAGKSVEGAAEIISDAPLWRAMPGKSWRYWVIVPSYETPHKEMDYLASWLAQLGILTSKVFPKGGSCQLTACGGRVVIETKTAQNLAAIAGEPCDGVLVIEAGQIAEGVTDAAQGRVMTRRGWIVYTGTLEDDENHPRWAWYQETAEKWTGNGPGADERAFSLPSWANISTFTGGEHDAEVQRLKVRLGPFTWARRVAARPTGNQYPAYGVLASRPDLMRPIPLIPCEACDGKGYTSTPCRECGASGMRPPFRWVRTVGGIDWGTVHLSAVVVVSLDTHGDAWVRACRIVSHGDADAVEQAIKDFTLLFGVSSWVTDPNERWAAKLLGRGARAVAMGENTRYGRIGLVNRRLTSAAAHLYYDQHGEGVPELYEEQRLVHYVKNGVGKLVLYRVNDDRTAALEDAIEELDGVAVGLAPVLGDTAIGEKPDPKPTPERQFDMTPPAQKQQSDTRQGAAPSSLVRGGFQA